MKPEQVEMPFVNSLCCGAVIERFRRYDARNPHVLRALEEAALTLAERASIPLCIHAVYWHARSELKVKCSRSYLPAYARLLEKRNPGRLRFEHGPGVFAGL